MAAWHWSSDQGSVSRLLGLYSRHVHSALRPCERPAAWHWSSDQGSAVRCSWGTSLREREAARHWSLDQGSAACLFRNLSQPADIAVSLPVAPDCDLVLRPSFFCPTRRALEVAQVSTHVRRMAPTRDGSAQQPARGPCAPKVCVRVAPLLARSLTSHEDGPNPRLVLKPSRASFTGHQTMARVSSPG